MSNEFNANTIRSEGALLPHDLLRRVQANDQSLPGLTPQAYHIPGGMRLNEAASRAWTALLGAWAAFQRERERLPTDDPGTTITREQWLLQLFQELNFGRLPRQNAVTVGEKTYAISHHYGHVPIHLVGCNVTLDTRTAGVAGAAAGSPHSIVQEYLNRAPGSLWGMVSNGLRLRVLRDSVSLTRQSYLEFDLEAMMNGEVYTDFVVLFLVLHQSRFEAEIPEETYIEQWSVNAAKTGTRALDTLRNGVEQAITALGEGFLRGNNPELKQKLRDSRLSTQDYYRQLLRMVYRLLFLFVAEDRDALHSKDATNEQRKRYEYYSTQRLRRMAAKIRGTRHADLFEQLKMVMSALADGGQPGLGLNELGSFLFSERATPELYEAQLPNVYLLRAIRALAYVELEHVRRPVDYKNLGSEELSSVYESLLELHPEVSTSADRFTLTTAAGNERKTTASFYTPSSLINPLLDSALEPVMDNAVRGKTTEDAIAALLDLKIVDPAVGSGHFLIAAAQRLAKRIAALKTGESEPAPDEVRTALRDVIGRCVYGVDINEMSAELCKVALWMEAIDTGKPLNFLEHRIQVGNSVFGTTYELVRAGIPDDAFKAIEGDDPSVATEVRKINREERDGGQGALFSGQNDAYERSTVALYEEFHNMPADTPAQRRMKEQAFENLQKDPAYLQRKHAFDAWCAAFIWPLQKGENPPTTSAVLAQLQSDFLSKDQLQTIRELADQHGFFHWELAFPEVFADGRGGFDVVLGNPPWDQIELDPREYFAFRAPNIANARTASARSDLLSELDQTNPSLFADYMCQIRLIDGIKHFIHASGVLPLASSGRLNYAPLFTELGMKIVAPNGYSGMVVPTIIATGAFYQKLFSKIVVSGRLSSFFDFENKNGIFPTVHRSYKFSLMTLVGRDVKVTQVNFVFFAHAARDLNDREKRFAMNQEEIYLFNPNTGTCPVFRSSRDFALTKQVYKKAKIFMSKHASENAWSVKPMIMFMLNTASKQFANRKKLSKRGTYEDGIFTVNDERFFRVYEGKMVHQFNHRFASFYCENDTKDASPADLNNPKYFSEPRHWISETHALNRLKHATPPGQREFAWPRVWYLGYRSVARSTDFRTAIFSLLPESAAAGSLPLLFVYHNVFELSALLANFNSFVFDYIARQKVGGTDLSLYILQQLPVLSPEKYSHTILKLVLGYVMELVYTAEDLNHFAVEAGFPHKPFKWNENRRFWLRAELDALFFHLYEIERDDVDYIMETFPIVKRRDIEEHGSYRTKEAILEIYDEMARCKAEGREYQTKLDPPPAHPSLTHGYNEGNE